MEECCQKETSKIGHKAEIAHWEKYQTCHIRPLFGKGFTHVKDLVQFSRSDIDVSINSFLQCLRKNNLRSIRVQKEKINAIDPNQF